MRVVPSKRNATAANRYWLAHYRERPYPTAQEITKAKGGSLSSSRYSKSPVAIFLISLFAPTDRGRVAVTAMFPVPSRSYKCSAERSCRCESGSSEHSRAARASDQLPSRLQFVNGRNQQSLPASSSKAFATSGQFRRSREVALTQGLASGGRLGTGGSQRSGFMFPDHAGRAASEVPGVTYLFRPRKARILRTVAVLRDHLAAIIQPAMA